MPRPAWTSLEPRELRVGLLGFGILLLAGVAEVTIKNVGDTLFIKRVGVEMLPAVFFPNAVLLVLTTGAVGWLASRVSPLGLLTGCLLVSGLALVPLFLLVRLDLGPSYWLLVMASKQVESVALIGFLVAIGHLLHARQSKRLLAPILAGSTTGQILGSFATDPLGRAFGIDGVLPVAGGALALAGLASLGLRPLRPARIAAAARGGRPPPREPAPPLRRLWREGWFFRALAWCSFAAGLLGPMVYFQFNYVADRANADEQGLLAFFSAFRGWLNFGVLGAQLALAPFVFRRFGVPLASLLSPAIYLAGLAGLSMRLSLPAGIAVMAGSTVSDHALFDPGQKVLANLFPESRRPRVNALIEGPIKRAGTVGGSLLVMGILALGGAPAVGLLGLPIAALWLVTGYRLWRSYPSLLLAVAGSRSGEGVDLDEVLDDRTLRVLAATVRSPDPATARAAVALLGEAPAGRAAQALAEVLADVPDALLGEVTRTLAECVDAALGDRAELRPLAEGLEAALRRRPEAPPEIRAHWLRLLGVALGADAARGAPPEPLLAGLRDPHPAVRLAALMALERLGRVDEPEDLRQQLAAAASSADPVLQRVAARELRSWLLATADGSDPGTPRWEGEWARRLELLGSLCARGAEEAEPWHALLAVARRCGSRTAEVVDSVLAGASHLPRDLAPCALRLIGYAGLRGRVDELIEALGAGDSRLEEAAVEGLRALGPAVVDRLLVALNFGGRRARDAIVVLLRELDVATGTLRELLEAEYRAIEDALVKRAALHPGGADPAVVQRLDERVDESTHSALLLLSTLLEDDRIAELSGLLRRAETDRERAVLVEALEALLPPGERARLLPLIEDRSPRRVSSARPGAGGIPDRRAVLEALLQDSDPLIRELVAATAELGDLPGAPGSAARGGGAPRGGTTRLGGAPGVRGGLPMLSEVEIVLHLRSLPIFSRLTLRQLSDLARVVRQETHPAGTILVREGDYEDCMYLIVSGRVRITREGAFVRELGPRDFFGEMAMFTGATRSATAEAAEPVHLLRIERQDLLRLMEELPGIAIAICQTLSERLAEMTARVGQ